MRKRTESPKFSSIREMQVYAALCLWSFCTHWNIRHQGIEELFQHLVSMATTDSLPDWEQRGCILVLAGRGDPIPEAIVRSVPREQLHHLSRLVEYGVEVGISTMYGAITEEPREALRECVRVLGTSGVPLPPAEPILKSFSQAAVTKSDRAEDIAWGQPIPCEELESMLAACGYQTGTM